VSPAQRRGVRRSDADEVPTVREGRVGERHRRPVGVEIDHVERLLVHEGGDITVFDPRPLVAVVSLEVLPREGDRLLVDVAAGDLPAVGGGPDAADAARGHRVQIRGGTILALAIGSQRRDRQIPVQFLSRIVEDRLLDALGLLPGDLEFDPALSDAHTTSRR